MEYGKEYCTNSLARVIINLDIYWCIIQQYLQEPATKSLNNYVIQGAAVGYSDSYIIRKKLRRRQWHPLQYSCPENPMDGGAWWAAVHGVAKSQTRLSNFTFTFHFHALEKEMATHSSVLAWRIPGMGEPGGLPSIGSHRVGHGHDWSDLAVAVAQILNLGIDRKIWWFVKI